MTCSDDAQETQHKPVNYVGLLVGFFFQILNHVIYSEIKTLKRRNFMTRRCHVRSYISCHKHLYFFNYSTKFNKFFIRITILIGLRQFWCFILYNTASMGSAGHCATLLCISGIFSRWSIFAIITISKKMQKKCQL